MAWQGPCTSEQFQMVKSLTEELPTTHFSKTSSCRRSGESMGD